MIVVFAAGGATEVLARIVAEHMGRTLKQRFVVENVAGAGGPIGGARGARAATDGYKLTVGSLGSHSATPALYKSPGFDPRQQEPIGLVAGTPSSFVARREFPAQTFAEYLTYAKANPSKVTMAYAGIGSTTHLACLFLEYLMGVKTTAVAYRGNRPAMADLVVGQIDGLRDLAPTAVPQINSGTIRALMRAMPERASTTPGVPTSREAGVPEYLFAGWNAIFAPKGTPVSVLATLSGALRALVVREVEKWTRVVPDAGVAAQEGKAERPGSRSTTVHQSHDWLCSSPHSDWECRG